MAQGVAVLPLIQHFSNNKGKFVAIRGTVVRVSNIRPLVTQMLFRCTRCGSGSQILALPDGIKWSTEDNISFFV